MLKVDEDLGWANVGELMKTVHRDVRLANVAAVESGNPQRQRTEDAFAEVVAVLVALHKTDPVGFMTTVNERLEHYGARLRLREDTPSMP